MFAAVNSSSNNGSSNNSLKRPADNSTPADESQPDTPAPPPKKRGKPLGAQSWKPEDEERLLECLEHWQPGGEDMWEEVSREYNTRAVKDGRKQRDGKFLRRRFRLLTTPQNPPSEIDTPGTPGVNDFVSVQVKRALRLKDEIDRRFLAFCHRDGEDGDAEEGGEQEQDNGGSDGAVGTPRNRPHAPHPRPLPLQKEDDGLVQRIVDTVMPHFSQQAERVKIVDMLRGQLTQEQQRSRRLEDANGKLLDEVRRLEMENAGLKTQLHVVKFLQDAGLIKTGAAP